MPTRVCRPRRAAATLSRWPQVTTAACSCSVAAAKVTVSSQRRTTSTCSKWAPKVRTGALARRCSSCWPRPRRRPSRCPPPRLESRAPALLAQAGRGRQARRTRAPQSRPPASRRPREGPRGRPPRMPRGARRWPRRRRVRGALRRGVSPTSCSSGGRTRRTWRARWCCSSAERWPQATRRAPGVHTACTPHAHRMHTACTPHAHRMRTACTLHAHCTCTLHVHLRPPPPNPSTFHAQTQAQPQPARRTPLFYPCPHSVTPLAASHSPHPRPPPAPPPHPPPEQMRSVPRRVGRGALARLI